MRLFQSKHLRPRLESEPAWPCALPVIGLLRDFRCTLTRAYVTVGLIVTRWTTHMRTP